MEINKAKPGNFCWFELATSDQAAAKKFYGGLFGWTANDSPMGPDAMEQMGPLPPCWIDYVQVANCDASAAKATSLGGKVCMPPMDIPNTGRFAMLQDPQGAMLSVIALAPMHKG